MKRSFDLLAQPYQPLERAIFGQRLQQARVRYLPALPAGLRHALIVGDGDGRFSLALLRDQPEIGIDSLDSSQAMIRLAQRRIQTALPREARRFRPIAADALIYRYPESQYDLIAVNFVLDCFTQAQIDHLLPKLSAALRPNGFLLYSDFQIPERSAARRLAATFLIRCLYLAFRLATGLQPQRLPHVAWPPRLQLVSQSTWLGQCLVSQFWQKTAKNDPHPLPQPSRQIPVSTLQ